MRGCTRWIVPLSKDGLRARTISGITKGNRLWNIGRSVPIYQSGGGRTFTTSTSNAFSFHLLTLVHRHKHVEPPKPGEGYTVMEKTSNDRLSVTFVTPEGDRTTLQVSAGDSLLDIAHEHDIDLEGSRYGSPI